ncbi:hypothetical protein SAMN05192568_107517 [Methylobacterium pseudosasicola]|uniref:Uncharacterized protein n=1 Tax=Methylobacterium pseudosasicola TaxID=582667 RepID=A0A1I4URW7_9HYPH|nr:hypothetical protein SAMN05192568_107517 [Methylobacterium pseudosasicola]
MNANSQIEITAQMIDAGAEIVWEYRGFGSSFVAEQVYLAMRSLAPDYLQTDQNLNSISEKLEHPKR